MIIHNFQLNIK